MLPAQGVQDDPAASCTSPRDLPAASPTFHLSALTHGVWPGKPAPLSLAGRSQEVASGSSWPGREAAVSVQQETHHPTDQTEHRRHSRHCGPSQCPPQPHLNHQSCPCPVGKWLETGKSWAHTHQGAGTCGWRTPGEGRCVAGTPSVETSQGPRRTVWGLVGATCHFPQPS